MKRVTFLAFHLGIFLLVGCIEAPPASPTTPDPDMAQPDVSEPDAARPDSGVSEPDTGPDNDVAVEDMEQDMPVDPDLIRTVMSQ